MNSDFDLRNITNKQFENEFGYSAVELVNSIDNNGDPNPRHLKYLSAPSHIPDVYAQEASQGVEEMFPYKLLYDAGIITKDQACHTAYELTYAQKFREYHSQPVVDELEKRLRKTSMPKISVSYPEEQPNGRKMPTMLMAVCGGSPQLIRCVIKRGLSVNPNLNNENSLTDIAIRLLMNRISDASQEEFATQLGVVSELRNNGGRIKQFTPEIINTYQQQQQSNDRTKKRYKQLHDVLTKKHT